MTAPPMRPWQNALALLGTVLAAGALLPLPPAARLLLATSAFAAIVFLLVVRMRAHRARGDRARVSGVYDRIDRIRADRAKRRSRPRR